MSDLVRRTDVLDVMQECHLDEQLFEKEVFDKIKNLPKIEAVPVVHGEWIKSDLLFEADKCTICNCSIYNTSGMNFCPNCGADMRKGGAT